MLGSFNFIKLNCKIIEINCEKIKINYNFLNYKYIIFLNQDKIYDLKNYLLKNKILSISLKNKSIKSIFNLPSFSFLRNGNYLCILINDTTSFINTINNLNDKQLFFSYKSCLSNVNNSNNIIKEYNKYNINYIYIQFFIKKIKIKIIILFLFLLISLIKYIK
jgi:hypothetical protein